MKWNVTTMKSYGLWFAALTLALPAAAYEESITFSFRSDSITYQGDIQTAWLMLDVEGGRNRVSDAQQMTCNNAYPKECSITISLPEGNFIYVYVANPDSYVDMGNPNLNPDDIPDQNFFRDPTPRDVGFCGQYSTDNCLFVRDPDRPTLDATTFEPGHGALITADETALRVRVNRGADGRSIDADSVRVAYESKEQPGLRFDTPVVATSPTWLDVDNARFVSDATGGFVEADLPVMPEGFIRLRVQIANDVGLAADDLVTGLLVNRDNQAPIASAGPTQFASPNQEVILDATYSDDPDKVGFAEFQWRVIEGPPGANTYFRCVDAELIPRDGYGKPFIDAHGNPEGDPCTRTDPGPLPRFAADRPGRYKIGLRVRDLGADGGVTSDESETEVVVVPGWNLQVRPRIEVAIDGDTVRLDGSLTLNSSGVGNFYGDAMNPSLVSLSPNGLVASFPKPSVPGAYFFHFTVDNAYPATAMVRVKPDGSVDGMDLARPPKAWTRDRVMYLGYVREFYDSDGDGEGDILGMIDRLAHLADLGVNSLWLMPLSEGPTTHGYATTGFFSVEEDYGTTEELELLLESAKTFGIEPILDLVANHTSDQHPFFKAARQNPASPLRQWYAFNPNGEYRYAFTFYALPDQDQNNPMVRQSVMEVVDWFMDRGFSGIRCDIAGFTPPDFWRLMRRRLKARNPDAIMLAELIPPMAEFFDDGFDLAYDSTSFHELHWAFAANGSFDALDNALEGATGFVSRAYSERVRQSVRQEDVLFMRYIDNQDEDRFLLDAGGDLRKARAVATVLFSLPGVPMMTYGNEVGIAELRGRMPFFEYNEASDTFSSAREQLRQHYRKLIAVRKGNLGLRVPDNAAALQPGNSYLRIASGFDEGGGNVYSFVRYGAGQRFIVMSNRSDSTAIGTRTRVYPPRDLFRDFPSGDLVLVDHLDPRVQLSVTKDQLLDAGGFVVNVPGFGSRIFQVTRYGLPDVDEDGAADSWDNCVGVSNERQSDKDADGVGDRCDVCPNSVPYSQVGLDGCAPQNGGSPRAKYVLNGSVVSTDYEVAAGDGIKLYASFNGKELYVATDAADRGEDVFILVTDNTGRVATAPFGKAGTVATDGIFLADEGENDFNGWFGVTGQADHQTEALPGRGHLEGTLNLVEQFGVVPEIVYLAAVRYGGADGASILAQAPIGNGNNNVEASEMFAFALEQGDIVEVDAGPSGGSGGGGSGGSGGGGPVVVTQGDGDGDGVEELVDNCPGLYNPAQTDIDGDGYGDACDACPISTPGFAVDEDGCNERETVSTGIDGDRPSPKIVDVEDKVLVQSLYGCSASDVNPGPFPTWALVLLAGGGYLCRRPHQRRKR